MTVSFELNSYNDNDYNEDIVKLLWYLQFCMQAFQLSPFEMSKDIYLFEGYSLRCLINLNDLLVLAQDLCSCLYLLYIYRYTQRFLGLYTLSFKELNGIKNLV